MAGVLKKKVVKTDTLTLARERISTLFDRYDHVNVSFSGGKDSTVVLNLCHDEAMKRGRKITVHFIDEEVIPPETEDYVRRAMKMPAISKFWWICLPTKQRNACSKQSPWWVAWDPNCPELWCRPAPPEGIFEYPGFDPEVHGTRNIQELLFNRDDGIVADVLGIRAQESLRRYRSVAKRETDNWISRSGTVPWVLTCKPIYDWTTEDVWTAPRVLGWDYNVAYDMMERFGISRHAQRVAPAFAEEPLRDLPIWRECWPEMWEKVLLRVPGAATAGRYSKTPLYGYGGVMKDRLDGMSWQEAIAHEITKFDPKTQRALAERLKGMVSNHERKCAERGEDKTVPEDEPHPHTGICWSLLYMIAKRGDLRNRKLALYGRNRDKDIDDDVEDDFENNRENRA
jgi:predicted phosphoadenosine phosphosulfate sulfurtransferase